MVVGAGARAGARRASSAGAFASFLSAWAWKRPPAPTSRVPRVPCAGSASAPASPSFAPAAAPLCGAPGAVGSAAVGSAAVGSAAGGGAISAIAAGEGAPEGAGAAALGAMSASRAASSSPRSGALSWPMFGTTTSVAAAAARARPIVGIIQAREGLRRAAVPGAATAAPRSSRARPPVCVTRRTGSSGTKRSVTSSSGGSGGAFRTGTRIPGNSTTDPVVGAETPGAPCTAAP